MALSEEPKKPKSSWEKYGPAMLINGFITVYEYSLWRDHANGSAGPWLTGFCALLFILCFCGAAFGKGNK